MTLAMCGLVAAADAPVAQAPAPAPASQAQPDEELDEVVAEGRRVREKPTSFAEYQQPFNFLARLVGQFVIEGNVDLQGEGNPGDLRKVAGRAHCVGFGLAPGVQCELTVRWPETRESGGEEIPGGISTLDPAVLLFGVDLSLPGVSHVFLDNRGVADNAVGEMTSPNTMLSRSKCVGIPGNCERVVRITAEPDLSAVRMDIDLALDQQKTVRYAFVMQRVPETSAVVYGRKQPKEEKK